MPQRPNEHSVSKRAGQFQRNRPVRVMAYRVQMDPEDFHLQLWWSPSGELFFDREVTEPTPWTIVRLDSR